MTRRLATILSVDMAGWTRLMERDEEAVLARHRALRREAIDPALAAGGGRVVKTTGDGLLAVFDSARAAVAAAVEAQREAVRREAPLPEDERALYRFGVNLGDVVFEEDDVFGDAVNVAARMQALAAPGGVCVSDVVHQSVGDPPGATFRDLGAQRIKGVSRPVRAWAWTADAPAPAAEPPAAALQRVRFAQAPDGVRLAWAEVGSGPPLLKAPNWLNHVEYEWRTPIWGPVLAALARDFRLVRFDQRGNGLSDREVDEISSDAMQADMTTVAEAAGLERFGLFGISQGCAFSIRYAAEHPERVDRLVLLNGYVRGRLRRGERDGRALYESMENLIREGWGSPIPTYRRLFTSMYMPSASPEEAATFDEFQRVAANPETAVRILRMNAEVDVSEFAPRVRAPTLVLHCAGDRIAPVEEGRLTARLIPDATFVELPGEDHVLLPGRPAFDRFVEETRAFLSA